MYLSALSEKIINIQHRKFHLRKNYIAIENKIFVLPRLLSGLARWSRAARRFGSEGREFNPGLGQK
jgi:hypothetical protein